MGLRGLDVTDDTISSIAKQCKGLERLDISLCTKLTEVSGISIGKNCTNLISLKAGHCKEVITDNVLRLIGTTCKSLSGLDISYCNKVTEEGLEGFLPNKQSFSMLVLNALENITGLVVIGILRNSLTTLEQLELAFLDPVIVCCIRVD